MVEIAFKSLHFLSRTNNKDLQFGTLGIYNVCFKKVLGLSGICFLFKHLLALLYIAQATCINCD